MFEMIQTIESVLSIIFIIFTLATISNTRSRANKLLRRAEKVVKGAETLQRRN